MPPALLSCGPASMASRGSFLHSRFASLPPQPTFPAKPSPRSRPRAPALAIRSILARHTPSRSRCGKTPLPRCESADARQVSPQAAAVRVSTPSAPRTRQTIATFPQILRQPTNRVRRQARRLRCAARKIFLRFVRRPLDSMSKVDSPANSRVRALHGCSSVTPEEGPCSGVRFLVFACGNKAWIS
jgi:hypothetical protein